MAAAAEQDLEELRPEPRAGAGAGVGVGVAGGHFSPRKRGCCGGVTAAGSGAGTGQSGLVVLGVGVGAGPQLHSQVRGGPLPPRDGHVREVIDGAREEEARTPHGGQRECGGERGRYDDPPREHRRRRPARAALCLCGFAAVWGSSGRIR